MQRVVAAGASGVRVGRSGPSEWERERAACTMSGMTEAEIGRVARHPGVWMGALAPGGELAISLLTPEQARRPLLVYGPGRRHLQTLPDVWRTVSSGGVALLVAGSQRQLWDVRRLVGVAPLRFASSVGHEDLPQLASCAAGGLGLMPLLAGEAGAGLAAAVVDAVLGEGGGEERDALASRLSEGAGRGLTLHEAGRAFLRDGLGISSPAALQLGRWLRAPGVAQLLGEGEALPVTLSRHGLCVLRVSEYNGPATRRALQALLGYALEARPSRVPLTVHHLMPWLDSPGALEAVLRAGADAGVRQVLSVRTLGGACEQYGEGWWAVQDQLFGAVMDVRVPQGDAHLLPEPLRDAQRSRLGFRQGGMTGEWVEVTLKLPRLHLRFRQDARG